jgi:hypothetical protein
VPITRLQVWKAEFRHWCGKIVAADLLNIPQRPSGSASSRRGDLLNIPRRPSGSASSRRGDHRTVISQHSAASERLRVITRLNHRRNRFLAFSFRNALFLRYNLSMSTDNARFASPSAREEQDTRRAKVAPLLAAGLSVRAIAAETGIPVGAVHRAKQQLEKIVAQGGSKAADISRQLPISYVIKQDIRGISHDVRRLTVSVYERAVENAIGRGLLGRGDRDNPWTVISTLFTSMFDDHTIEWLSRRGYLHWGQRGQGEAIIAAVNAVIGRHR